MMSRAVCSDDPITVRCLSIRSPAGIGIVCKSRRLFASHDRNWSLRLSRTTNVARSLSSRELRARLLSLFARTDPADGRQISSLLVLLTFFGACFHTDDSAMYTATVVNFISSTKYSSRLLACSDISKGIKYYLFIYLFISVINIDFIYTRN
jgi:hypothetical protein